MEEPHRVTAETVGGENGDLTGDQAAAASERHRSEGDYHGLSVPVHDSPYRPGMRPKVPTAPAGYGGGAVVAGGSGMRAVTADGQRRAYERSPSAAGPQTFGSKYMPFAAGFSHQAGEAPVYRSSRLHAINPTAAVNEDTSYMYTLDSGRETPATHAANPNHGAEHVRNTAAAASARGGFMGKVFASFARQRNLQLLPQDEAWTLFNMLVGLSGLGKWAMRAELPPLLEALTIVAWTAWGPLHLFLIRRRREWYLSHRNAFVVVMRITRWLLCFSNVPAREDVWVGPARKMPTSPMAVYTHICWKVNFLITTAFGIVLPMRFFLPCQLGALLLSLRATGGRCRQECGLPPGAAAAGAAAVAATCGSSIEPGGAGVCPAGASAAGVAQYYLTAAGWIRRLAPSQLLRLSARWRRRRGGSGVSCTGACFATHSWLQVTGGVLLPTLVLWLWEDRLRTRHLQLLIGQQSQQQGRQQRETGHSQVAPGVEPMPTTVALGWFAGTAWLLWLLLEALVL
ncbi:hypothetical protein ABPG77_003359 [Micractinium sp. CCAP 211/92]